MSPTHLDGECSKEKNYGPWETTFLAGTTLSKHTFQDAALGELGRESRKEKGVYII